MARPGTRLALAALVLAASGLAGCGGGDDGSPDAPRDAAVGDFCRQLEDAPGADATAEDYRDYAGRLLGTGTPRQVDGAAREGFELFVGYLADLDDGDVDRVKASDEPSDVFTGAEADKVESFKQGYVLTCVDATDASPSASPTGGALPGLSEP